MLFFFSQNSDISFIKYIKLCYPSPNLLQERFKASHNIELLFLADLLLVLMTHGVEDCLGVSLQGT